MIGFWTAFAGYFFIFLVMIAEGPVVTAVVSFGASLGIFNIYLIIFLSFAGNVIGDFIPYALGRAGGKIFTKKAVRKISDDKIRKIKNLFKIHPGKTILVIKLTPFLPLPGFMVAGGMKVPAKKFFFYSAIISFAYTLFFAGLGFFSGAMFNKIYGYVKYADLIIFLILVIFILIYLIARKIAGKVANKIEKI